MARKNDPIRRILSEADEAKLVEAIREVERRTSGEVRIHVESRAGGDPMAAARRWFASLRMDRTARRNGVLIYLAVEDRAFAILGDQGIHAKLGDLAWAALRDDLHESFVRGAFVAGLERAVRSVGSLLAQHFPPEGQERNELPDSVSQ